MAEEQCTKKQADYLRDLGGDPTGLTKAQARTAIEKLAGKSNDTRVGNRPRGGITGLRVGPGPITEAQKSCLKKYGVDTKGLTKAQAAQRIQAIADNGWKLPAYDADPIVDDDIPFGDE